MDINENNNKDSFVNVTYYLKSFLSLSTKVENGVKHLLILRTRYLMVWLGWVNSIGHKRKSKQVQVRNKYCASQQYFLFRFSFEIPIYHSNSQKHCVAWTITNKSKMWNENTPTSTTYISNLVIIHIPYYVYLKQKLRCECYHTKIL